MNVFNKRIDFGKFNKMLWTRVPVHYLKWMVNVKHTQAETADAELKRRGTVTPNMELSGHSINRASLILRKKWHQTRGEEEGIYSWLLRMSSEALSGCKPDDDGCIFYNEMKFVFQTDATWPVLKTIMPFTLRDK